MFLFDIKYEGYARQSRIKIKKSLCEESPDF